jgi:hypothetical protein
MIMKKILSLLLIAAIATFSSCDKDDSENAPAVANPANTTVEIAASADITFNYTTDAKFKSSNAVATNGTVVIKTDGVAGSKSGSVVVTFTAGAAEGAGSVVLTITDEDDQTGTATAVISIVEEEIEIDVTGNITENTTWETGKVYTLTSRIAVVAGATLTIEPGVIVKGEAGTGANATALLVARGGKLMAEGTADAPIIFTSVADEIMPGEVAGPNLDPTLNGLWGGVIICG